MNYYTFPGLEKKEQRKFLLGNIDHIINVVCDMFEITTDDVKSSSRQRIYTEPRQIIIYFLRQKTELSFKMIGEMFKRDHSTIIYSCQFIESAMSVDKKFRAKVERIESLI